MNYNETQHEIKQSRELALRQAIADQHSAPQRDMGTVTWAAMQAKAEKHYAAQELGNRLMGSN